MAAGSEPLRTAMNTLLSHYSKILLDIYRLAQELPVEEFQDGVLCVLKAYLPFDSSMWGTAQMTATGIDIHSLHLHNTTQAMIDAYEKVKHLDKAAMQVSARPTATMGFNTAIDFSDAELKPYKSFLEEYRHENFFITSEINPMSRFAHWVSLYRFERRQLCTPEETEFLSCLAPHLMQALAINRRVHLDRLTGDAAREKWSVAIADRRGIIYHADRRFLDLVQDEWSLVDAERLPQSLIILLTQENNHICGTNIILHRTLDRGMLYLKARYREAVDDLTMRELLIARLLISGLTQKQVASKLGRSHETVRSHVKSIFDKLSINNVAMLGPKLALLE